jgi:NAD(P)-dependent dehydrogenase (short-subunit alcohol dehydrogenase family)
LRKKICVIDGQGGGIGAALIKGLKEAYGESVEILAVGTNAIATSQMMKARANRGATGENAIVRTAATADAIVGPVSITWANAMMGEVTPLMAEAVTSSPAPKFLLPLSQENIMLVGLSGEPLPHLVDEIVTRHVNAYLKEYMKDV